MVTGKKPKKEVQVISSSYQEDVPGSIELKASPVSDAFALIEKAITANAPIETMERLLAMRDKLRAEEAEVFFRGSMSAFQAACPVIEKRKIVYNKDGRSIRYKYAPIDDIVRQVQPLLEANGLSYDIDTVSGDYEITVIVTAAHLMGYTKKTHFTVPVDKEGFMTAPQKWAAAQTYAKRYAFCNAFGILTGDEDDDAVSVTPPAPPKDENVEKLTALSENVKEGLRLMGVNRKQAIDLCVNNEWDEAKIMLHVNKVIDSRGAK